MVTACRGKVFGVFANGLLSESKTDYVMFNDRDVKLFLLTPPVSPVMFPETNFLQAQNATRNDAKLLVKVLFITLLSYISKSGVSDLKLLPSKLIISRLKQ